MKKSEKNSYIGRDDIFQILNIIENLHVSYCLGISYLYLSEQNENRPSFFFLVSSVLKSTFFG